MAREQKLNVEITANDRASAKIDAAAKKVESLDGETATAKIDADSSGFDDVVDALDDKLGGVLGSLKGAAGPGGLVAALGGGLVLAAEAAADVAIEADNTARLTGDSVEEASKLSGIWRQAGFDNKDLQDVLLQMNGVLTTSPELAEKLGINLGDGATIGERFQQVIRILGEDFTDAGERSQMASQLFGEEGVRQVNAVEGAYGDLSTAVDKYSGKVFTAEDVRKAREYKRAVGEVKTEFTTLASEIGGDVLPEITTFLSTLTDVKRKSDEIGASGFVEKFLNPWGPAKDAIGEVKSVFTDELDPALDDLSEKLTGKVTDAWGEVTAAAKEAMEVDPQPVSDAASIIDAEIGRAIAAVDRFGSDGVENMNDVGDAADDTESDVDGVRRSFERLRGEINNRQAYRDLEQAFDDVKASAADAYGAVVAGSEDAEQKAREHQTEVDNLRLDVIDYMESLGQIPAQKATDIMALIDQGAYDEAMRLLALLERERVIRVRVETGQINPNLKITPGVVGAEGGIVNRPTVALIGEAGPEAVVPLHKVPGNSPLPSLGGGGAVNINVTVNASGIGVNGTQVGREVAEVLEQYARNGGRLGAATRRAFGGG